jgi:hypothetical protein
MTALMLAAGGGTDIQRMRLPEERATAFETAKLLLERGHRRECRRTPIRPSTPTMPTVASNVERGTSMVRDGMASTNNNHLE